MCYLLKFTSECEQKGPGLLQSVTSDGSVVKNLPAMQEVPSPSQEDSLEKEMATQSSILAWEIPWTVKPGGL